MASRPGRRTSQLEFVVALALMAFFAGWWAERFGSAQTDVRILQVREAATAMRMLSREVHLQALVANRVDFTGMMATAYGPIEMQAGFATATPGGIGQLVAAQIPAERMRCDAVRLPNPVQADQSIAAYQCAPAELDAGARERCAARYLPPLWPGGEPSITFLFHTQPVESEPCAN